MMAISLVYSPDVYSPDLHVRTCAPADVPPFP